MLATPGSMALLRRVSQLLLLTFLFLTSTKPSWGSFLAQGAQCVAVLLPGFP